jgi:hypothetical protein
MHYADGNNRNSISISRHLEQQWMHTTSSYHAFMQASTTTLHASKNFPAWCQSVTNIQACNNVWMTSSTTSTCNANLKTRVLKKWTLFHANMHELPCMFILSLTNMHAITMSWRVQRRLQVAYLKACMLKKWTTYIIMWSTWGYEYFIKCSYDYNTNADIKHGTVSSTLSTSFHFICICSTIQLFAMNVSSSQRLLKGHVLDHSFEWFNT